MSAPKVTLHQPVSQRVANIISERIREGVYPSGQPLPSERALAIELKVHRRTVRTAVERLINEGVIEHKSHLHSLVKDASASTEEPVAPLQSLSQSPSLPQSRISSSNLMALLMWHGGGPLEHAGTAQQRIFWGMKRALKTFHHHAIFLDYEGDITTDDGNAEQEAVNLRYVLEQKLGGLIFYPYAYERNIDLVREVVKHVPLVLIDRMMPGVDADFVGVQNRKSVYDLTSYLYSLGHRRIAHFTYVEPIHSVIDRAVGYVEAMRDHDRGDSDEIVIALPRYEDGRQWTTVDALFNLPPDRRPTAAVCLSDYVAVNLADRLSQLGLSVPEDVAITGFDNIIPALSNGTGLTTVEQPFEDIGAKAVELLMRRSNDPKAPTVSVELPGQIVVRDSTRNGVVSS